MRRTRILLDEMAAQEEWIQLDTGVEQEAPADADVLVEIDASLGRNFFIRLHRNIRLAAPHGLLSGRTIRIMFQQDQVGGWTVTPESGWTFAGLLSSFHVDTTADAATFVELVQTEDDIETPRVVVISSTGLLQQSTPISDPAGGVTVDTECRAAVIALLFHLRTIGIVSP